MNWSEGVLRDCEMFHQSRSCGQRLVEQWSTRVAWHVRQTYDDSLITVSTMKSRRPVDKGTKAERVSMRSAIWVIAVLVGSYSAASSNSIIAHIDSLEAVQHELRSQIVALQDEIDSLEVELQYSLISHDMIAQYEVSLKHEGKMRPEPSVFVADYILVPKGTTVTVHGYTEGYYHVTCLNNRGYMHEMYFPVSRELEEIARLGSIRWEREQELRRAHEDSVEAHLLDAANTRRKMEAAAREEEAKQLAVERALDLRRKYGSEIAGRIINNQIWLHMTAEMAIDSMGSPDSVNRSVGSYGVHEQWVYGSTYLYFKNGQLDSWQEKNGH